MKTIFTALGLAALIAGCGPEEHFTQASCAVGGMEAKVDYTRGAGWWPDSIAIGLYNKEQLVGTMFVKPGSWLLCDDGRRIEIDHEIGGYFKANTKQ